MKAKVLSLCVMVVVVGVLFFALAGLASGQGPVLTTLPTPTPVPVTPDTMSSFDVTPQEARPDLTVEKIETDPAIPLVGESTLISVTVKNQGVSIVPEGNNFLTDLYIDPPYDPIVNYHQIVSATLGLPWGAQWFFVPPGGSYVFTTTWVFTDVKTFDVWAQVDTDNNVVEEDEYNNTQKRSVSVLTAQSFVHDTHQDFLTNMASTVDDSDPYGVLRLGHFIQPPYIAWPFSSGCQITPGTVTVSDQNMEMPDRRINQVMTGGQVEPHLFANGEGVVIAVWQDGRNGDVANQDIYLRYSTDWGQTWGTEIRVNDDDPASSHVNQLYPVAALGENGNLLVAWQDRRNGNYDIYAQRFVISNTTLITDEANILVGGPGSYNEWDQKKPDITVDEAGGFYVTWQDNRNGNDDVFATSYIPDSGGYNWTLTRQVNDDNAAPQQNPTVQILDWLKPTGVTYTVAPTSPYTVTVTGVISEPARILVVTWEDGRQGYNDIAIAVSADGGETFGFDGFLTDSSADGHQQKPDVTLTKDTSTINFAVPLLPDDTQAEVEVEVPVSDIHTVWEGHNSPGSDGDIYYNASRLAVEQIGDSNAFGFVLNLGSQNQQINQNDTRAWQTAPADQRDPSLVAAPCGVEADEGDWNLFIVWADGRNYDGWNYDIYYTVRSTCEGMPGGLAMNQMVNDGVRLHNFDASNPSYDDYDVGSPPPGYQVKPSVAADIQTDWPFVLGGYLYLVWQDDRAGDHQLENDIYFARSNLTYFNQNRFYGAGGYISDILDSESDETTWYTIDWSAATDASTYVTVQTRLGDTIGQVLASDWVPQRFPFQPQTWDCDDGVEGDESGAPIAGYDAPGQHIEDAAGDFWPHARYVQYRVNFYTRDSTKTPALDHLTIHFDDGGPEDDDDDDDDDQGTVIYTYLPILLK